MMLEEDSWVDAYDFEFPNTCDKNLSEEVSSLASENTGTVCHCFKCNNIQSVDSEFCQKGLIVDNKKSAVGENSDSFPLVPVSMADYDLSFIDENRMDKEPNDLLYYNSSEMGDFEDVNMMFSSCDSTFGLGAGNEDDLGWFSSSDPIGGFADGLKSDFLFQDHASEDISCRLGVSREASSSISDSGAKNQPGSYYSNLWTPQKDESPSLSNLSSMNASSNSECKLVPQQNINMYKKHTNHEDQSEGKRKCASLENCDALQHSGIKFENSGDLEGICTGIPEEFVSSIALENSSTSSGLDETGEEAAGFHQLQRVTEQLDLRTKLCMRDSFYRLARSAGHRHRDTNAVNDSGDNRDTNQASISERTNKRKGYMDMESNTNPIDRSIAHLLFLKSPGSSSVLPA